MPIIPQRCCTELQPWCACSRIEMNAHHSTLSLQPGPRYRQRVLCVDDEPALKKAIAAILEAEGFEAVTAETVKEALALIANERFDLLVSDLNLGQLSDGFTIVSVMKRLQPRCRTLILTGFPDFDAALKRLRGQADGFLVKPLRRQVLVDAVKKSLSTLPVEPSRSDDRLASLLRQHRKELIGQWLQEAARSGNPAHAATTESERTNQLQLMIDEIANTLEARQTPAEGQEPRPQAGKSAAQHDHPDRKQNHPPELLCHDIRILRSQIFDLVFLNLHSMDPSCVLRDLAIASDALDAVLAKSINASAAE